MVVQADAEAVLIVDAFARGDAPAALVGSAYAAAAVTAAARGAEPHRRRWRVFGSGGWSGGVDDLARLQGDE